MSAAGRLGLALAALVSAPLVVSARNEDGGLTSVRTSVTVPMSSLRVSPSATSILSSPGPEDLLFAPVLPDVGAHFESPSTAPTFLWRPGGLERFRVEFSGSPDFSHAYREKSGFGSATHYVPGPRAWDRIRDIGRCGHPVYWRVVAKIPGALGVVPSDRVSWFVLDPSVAHAILFRSDEPNGDDESSLPSPRHATFRLAAESTECRVTESRIDFDGDGWWDASTSHAGGPLVAWYSHAYSESGTYPVKAEILSGEAVLAEASMTVTLEAAARGSSTEKADLGICAIVNDRAAAGEPDLSCLASEGRSLMTNLWPTAFGGTQP